MSKPLSKNCNTLINNNNFTASYFSPNDSADFGSYLFDNPSVNAPLILNSADSNSVPTADISNSSSSSNLSLVNVPVSETVLSTSPNSSNTVVNNPSGGERRSKRARNPPPRWLHCYDTSTGDENQ